MERLTWTDGECYRLWKRSPERKKKLDYATHTLGRPPHIEERDNGQRDGEEDTEKTEGRMQNKHAKAHQAAQEKDKKATKSD